MNFATELTSEEQWKAEIEGSAGTVQGGFRVYLWPEAGRPIPALTCDSLAVIEVYQDWCGPCKAITGTFRRLCFDLGDRPLKFYTVGGSPTY